MDNPKRPTRGATRAADSAPPPLFSPARLSFGTVDPGDLLDLETLAVDSSMNETAASAARTTHASALGSSHASAFGLSATSVARQPSAARIGVDYSELPSLRGGSVDFGVGVDGLAPPGDEENGGWTPVPRTTSRSHREHSVSNRSNNNNAADSNPPEHETGIALATHEMSHEQLVNLVRRQEIFAAQLRAEMERRYAQQENNISDVAAPVKLKGVTPPESHDSGGKPTEPVGRAQSSRRATIVEEVYDDPGHAIENFAKIHRVENSERVTTPREVLVDVSLPHPPKSEAKEAKSPAKALTSDGKTPMSNNASELKLAASQTEPPRVHEVEPNSRSEASGRDSKIDHGTQSGQTHLIDEEKIVVQR